MNEPDTILFVLEDFLGKAFVLDRTKYRSDIQVLRGLAVLAVVLFHVNDYYFPLGYLGVDVFFVISGFVVTPLILRINLNRTNKGKATLFNLMYFYKRRFFRLAPALAVTLSISALTIFLIAPISDHDRFARQGLATLLLIGNVGAYKYSGDYFSSNPNPLVHTWSLSVEEQIYIFLPLIMTLFFYKLSKLKYVIVGVFGLVTVTSFISFLFPRILQPLYSSVLGIMINPQISFYSPIDRIWQFTTGSLTFLLFQEYRNRAKLPPKSIHLLVVLGIVTILFSSININEKINSIIASLFAAIIIFYKSLDVLPNLLIQKFEWLGDRSYSIYLVHMPLLYLAKYSPVIQIGNDEHFLVQSVIAMIASILLGSLSYSRIENRYRDKSSRGYGGTSGFIKFFVSAFIVPLTIFVIFLGYSEKSNKSMYKDRLDNGECKFWMPNLDDKFYSRFQSCYSKLGPAVVVLGDSHAMNIYNSLFLVTRSKFFVGISAGGCRPVSPANSCFYEDFEELIKSTPQTIKEVIFHQSGSHLISDEQGKLDSESAFRTPDSYIIVNKEIQQLISFLSKIGKQVPLIWIGPFGELRVERTWIHAKANLIEPNPIVRKAFLDLEKQINVNLKKEAITLRYVSSIVTLGNNQFNYKVGSCTLFRDVDHWSTCAEELFSIPLERAYRKSWEHSISTNDTYTFRNQSPIIRGEIK